MAARLIDGRAVAADIKDEVRHRIEASAAHGARRPGLAAVKVGDDAASSVYGRGKRIRPSAIIERIDPAKDVDGFHPYNIGRLAQRIPLMRPCTPFGVIRLLEHIGAPFNTRGCAAP